MKRFAIVAQLLLLTSTAQAAGLVIAATPREPAHGIVIIIESILRALGVL